MKEVSFYGYSLPGFEDETLAGRLIVIEGPDSVGRSTHISLLKPRLEAAGYAVFDTGMTRSELAGRGIKNAKEGHILGNITMSLFYATDFADRLENQIIPALRAGFIVLTDRYIYSAMARAIVRGADPDWIRAVYGFALVPDAIFYLRVPSSEDLVPRVLAGRGFDYWESGMDMRLGEYLYDSFVAYQQLMLEQFDHMEQQYGFEVINASRPMDEVYEDLEQRVWLAIEGKAAPPLRPERPPYIFDKISEAEPATAQVAESTAEPPAKPQPATPRQRAASGRRSRVIRPVE
jgi:dTMP kinase